MPVDVASTDGLGQPGEAKVPTGSVEAPASYGTAAVARLAEVRGSTVVGTGTERRRMPKARHGTEVAETAKGTLRPALTAEATEGFGGNVPT